MFGFLKDKLKSWLGKSKNDIEETVEKKEVKVVEKKKEEKVTKKVEKQKEEPKKEIKTEKKVKDQKEIKSERRITDKVLKDIKKEEIEIKTPEEKTEDLIVELEKQKEEELLAEKEELKEEKLGFFARLKKVFTYTLTQDRFEEIFMDLEMLLLESNVALEVVEKLKEDLQKELVGKEINKDKLETEITSALRNSLNSILIDPEDLIKKVKDHKKNSDEPYTILFFGINGAGKTTSIAKIAHLILKNKLTCVLAAGDTFRAASIEQISIHADRLGVDVIKHEYGSDPASVGFDAIKYAKNNKIDVVLIDTAGRMHTKDNLLQEMEKICRVTKPNLKIFVAEAVSGNDATEQAKKFNELIGIDASILSKTDVDEKGGAIISISYITKKPILYLGTGQGYDEIELFNKEKFIERLGL